MNAEQSRLTDNTWKKWGPYVSNREWGNVREDYSADGDAWNYTTHNMAESKAYRWAEEGIAGISDADQFLCFALSLWNYKDAIVKERFFGLSNEEGNHGEDVKELFYYLDSTPTHSYMKMLYKYPQQPFPYDRLVQENAKRSRLQPEFELIDTGVFDNNEYFDIFIEYAKADKEDLLIKISVFNRAETKASLKLLPTLWFRNTWDWGYDDYKPQLKANNGSIDISHKSLKVNRCFINQEATLLFCDNETNNKRLYHVDNKDPYYKDGINTFIIRGDEDAVNPLQTGTKAAFCVDLDIDAQASAIIQLRLCDDNVNDPFKDFEKIFTERINEANAFYKHLQKGIATDDAKLIHRQAIAGLLWSKQFYHYNVDRWLTGDPAQIPPPGSRWHIRNMEWRHLNNHDIISMPDKWEYPWYASWDLAFHCISLSLADPEFAKNQLVLMTREWYMHPSGEFPAYEWDFNCVNPPVYAWATFRVFKIDEKEQGKPDVYFLEEVFQKLLLNFTWWVNRKDKAGNNIFEGGFLGMDNIGLFDRNERLPGGAYLEQADATGWMAMYALNMMRIALELALYNKVYESMATKFFEHFLYIADAINNMGNGDYGLWDDQDEFFYDSIKVDNATTVTLKLRSMVGLVPMFAVEVFEDAMLDKLPAFAARMKWVLDNKPRLANLVSHWDIPGMGQKRLLSLLRGHRLKKLLERMLDPNAFLSDYGVRSLSKEYEQKPFRFTIGEKDFTVTYTPAESDSGMFGGNSNWRGPVWWPLNFLIIESLERFHFYFGDDFKVPFPAGSGNMRSLNEVAAELGKMLCNIFLRNKDGKRPVNGACQKIQQDEHFKDYIQFYEYFHGDSGKGLGASHQTGWTALVAKLLQPRFS
ncbi:MAG: glucosidase [Niabella sp.]